MIKVINGITVKYSAETAMRCVAFKDALVAAEFNGDGDEAVPP